MRLNATRWLQKKKGGKAQKKGDSDGWTSWKWWKICLDFNNMTVMLEQIHNYTNVVEGKI